MKKILFVTNYPSPYRVDFFNQLGQKDSIQLDVVFLESIGEQTHRSAGWFHEDYDFFNAIFLDKTIKISRSFFVCKDIISLVKKPYDEIIFGGYNYPTMIYAMIYLRTHKRSFSIEIDGGLIAEDSYLKYAVKRFLISGASKWYSTGAFSDKYLLHYGAEEKSIYHYPFSSLKDSDIDSDHLSKIEVEQRKREYRTTLHIEEEKVVLAVGQFIHRKGFDILLKCVKQLPNDIGIYIVGGTAPREYQDFISSNKLTNVHIVDFKPKDELSKYYFAADIFVLPTREDIWGLVINEALAHGVPTITTNRCVAGIEMIENGKNGFIVDVDNEEQLCNAIVKCFNSDLYVMRKNALAISKKYTIEKMADRHEQIISGGSYE